MNDIKVSEYVLVSDKSDGALGLRISELLQQGWQPYGTPFFGRDKYCQAMIKGGSHLEGIAMSLNEMASR